MQLRVNIRKLKQLVWLACILVFAWAAWTFYDIYSAKDAGQYAARKPAYFEELLRQRVDEDSAAQRKAFYAPERYENLWGALVDGSQRRVEQPVQETAAPEVPAIVVPDLATIVDVSLVVYSADPLARFVAINYLDGDAAKPDEKRRRLHLSEGDPLMPPYDEAPYNGRVKRIDLQEVVFDWGEDEVVLTPDLGPEGGGVTVDQFQPDEWSDPTSDYPTPPALSVELEPGRWLMGSEDLALVSNDPHRFLEEDINLRSITMSGGTRTHLEITKVKEGSLAAKYGAKVGDKIISVNGIPMPSVAAAINWFKANSDLPEYVVVYESKGQQHTTTIHVK